MAVIIAYGFHNSASIAIPFYLFYLFLSIVENKKSKNQTLLISRNNEKGFTAGLIVVGALFLFLFFKYYVISDYITPYLMSLDMFEYNDYLEDYSQSQNIRWWVLVYYAIILFFLTVYYVREHNIFKRYATILSIVGILVYLSFFGFGNLMRLAMYFVPFNIIVLPNVASMLRATYNKQISLGFALFNMVYIMKFSVEQMISKDYESGTGFYSYTFSFLNW